MSLNKRQQVIVDTLTRGGNYTATELAIQLEEAGLQSGARRFVETPAVRRTIGELRRKGYDIIRRDGAYELVAAQSEGMTN